jgi:hypothetical protein
LGGASPPSSAECPKLIFELLRPAELSQAGQGLDS